LLAGLWRAELAPRVRKNLIKDKIPALIKDKFSLQMPSLPLIRKNDTVRND
jgi:hypothetical protein